jgi:hypothetical protein
MTIAAATAAVVSRILDVIGMILPLLPIAFSDPNFGRIFLCRFPHIVLPFEPWEVIG